jgi:hypothetical protein
LADTAAFTAITGYELAETIAAGNPEQSKALVRRFDHGAA